MQENTKKKLVAIPLNLLSFSISLAPCFGKDVCSILKTDEPPRPPVEFKIAENRSVFVASVVTPSVVGLSIN